jgi:hypothetical protein
MRIMYLPRIMLNQSAVCLPKFSPEQSSLKGIEFGYNGILHINDISKRLN